MKSSSSSIFSLPRKGMEIAISTLVVMILGIAIVGGGIILVTKISGSGIDLAESLSEAQESRLQEMLRDGQLVAVYPGTQEVAGGKTATYGIGVFNTLGETTDFTIAVVREPAAARWRVNHFSTLTAPPNAVTTAQVVITPDRDAPKGTYTFIVNVTYEGESGKEKYDTRFFTVKVE